MLTTFGDIKRSRVLQIASANPDGPEFASLVNAATRQLMTRGSWWGTVQGIRGCVYDGCVVWPRTVSAVLALNANNHPTKTTRPIIAGINTYILLRRLFYFYFDLFRLCFFRFRQSYC